MITVSEYKGQKVGVFGLGRAGEATVAALRVGGAEVWAWDDDQQSVDRLQGTGNKDTSPVTCHLSPVAAWPWKDLKALVLSPGVPLTHPEPHQVVTIAKQHGCPIIGDIELLYRACPKARYIGITGTNGKSTTTTLIGHILKNGGVKAEVGGNLGMAALSLEPLGDDGTYVLELSSYQLDLLKTTRFNIAALLNVTPDHLDRHGGMEGYIAAKTHIFDRQQTGDVAVVAVDDEYTREMAECGVWSVKCKPNVIRVSAQKKIEGGIYVENGVLHDAMPNTPHSTPYTLSSIQTLTGQHNWQNAAVAYAVARACGLAADDIYDAMKSFAGLRHRLQLVATVGGVRFINDSKATNADATSNALAPYDTIYWIAGGKAKEGGIDSLAQYFPKISHAFLIGDAQEQFAATLKGKVPYSVCGTLKTATTRAAEMAFADKKKDAVVLLSPACASFDQWKNFEERGDAFCEMVSAFSHRERGGASRGEGPHPSPLPEGEGTRKRNAS